MLNGYVLNAILLVAIAVDTSEMRFLEEKNTSICIRLYKTEDCCLSVSLSVCLYVLLMNKTSTNSLIFYFDKAKQKKCVFRLHEKNIVPKYFVFVK